MKLEEGLVRPCKFRFSLRTLFVLFSLVAVWLGWSVYQIQQREQVKQYILARGALIKEGPSEKPWKRLPMTWRLLFVEPVSSIDMHNEFERDDPENEYIRAAFPEAEIYNFR